jgi:hypothetical protein
MKKIQNHLNKRKKVISIGNFSTIKKANPIEEVSPENFRDTLFVVKKSINKLKYRTANHTPEYRGSQKL